MSLTEEYYQDNSKLFFDETVNADVSLLHEKFLSYVPSGGRILDFGCGSGRDAKFFASSGYVVSAIDGSSQLCELARAYSGVDVKCMDFMEFDEKEAYDAIWACASLLHVKTFLLPSVIDKMRLALVPGGIMYMSFKRGEFEGERDGRFFNDMTEESFASVLASVKGLTLVEQWYSEDVRRGKDVRWFNAVVRKDET